MYVLARKRGFVLRSRETRPRKSRTEDSEYAGSLLRTFHPSWRRCSVRPPETGPTRAWAGVAPTGRGGVDAGEPPRPCACFRGMQVQGNSGQIFHVVPPACRVGAAQGGEPGCNLPASFRSALSPDFRFFFCAGHPRFLMTLMDLLSVLVQEI